MHRSILIADLPAAPLGGVYQWQICKLQLYGGLPMADLQAPTERGSTNGRYASFNPTGVYQLHICKLPLWGVYQWQICKLQLYGGLPMADLHASTLQGSTNGRSTSCPSRGSANGRSARSNSTGVYQWPPLKFPLYMFLNMAGLSTHLYSGSTYARPVVSYSTWVLLMAGLPRSK
jgi:hypothetical protein